MATNYSLKTEALRTTKQRQHATDFLGYYEDIIVARPKVDDLLDAHTLQTIPVDELGALVLQYYNERIVTRFQWHVISFLLRLDTDIQAAAPYEFIYWEERPPTVYDPADYWWRDSGKATGANRNINGFPHAVAQSATPLPRAKFKFTSGGKQFYILYEIPRDADTWTVPRANLTIEQVQEALRDLLRRQANITSEDSTT